MTILLKQFFSLINLLNSDTGHNQIAAGIACGLVLGFAPAFSLQTVLIILLLFFFRIQIGAALLSMAGFKLIAYLLDPVSNIIGMNVLEIDSLRPLFTELYNMPIIPLTRFYNSIVMGSGVISLILAVPVFFLSKALILKYRATIVAKYHQTKFFKALKATKLYGMYLTYEKFQA
jgi:uncharacterized protein (TIGR03546 family)